LGRQASAREGSKINTPEADREATAFLAMARNLRNAEQDREQIVGPHRERYDRAYDDLRVSPEKRVKVAAEFLRAAHRASHVYDECVEEGHEEYRQMIVGEEENS
jgi:hypothetical protein